MIFYISALYYQYNVYFLAPTSSVQNVTLEITDFLSITVSWNQVDCSNQNGPITGYLLKYTNVTYSEIVNITDGNKRTYTVNNLNQNTSYTFTLAAYNDGGIGPYSHEETLKTGLLSLLYAYICTY